MSETTIHNPPTCTCRRIVWLHQHCVNFELNIDTKRGSGHIAADQGGGDGTVDNPPEIFHYSAFPVENLAETVAECFHYIWSHWEPEEGVKA